MDYLCLAAGKGTRMGELGRYLQKCMYPVGLRPFLEFSVRNLRRSAGLDPAHDRLTLIVGHHAEQVRAYFGDAYDGLPIRYLEQPEPLGTGHALKLAADALAPTGPVIVWLADLYVPRALFEALQRRPEPNAQTLGPGHADESDALRATVEGERVTRAWNGAGELYDIGLWKLEPTVLSAMTEVRAAGGEYRALPNLDRAIDRGARVGALRAESWIHLGGTQPSPEANVRAVVERLWELEAAA